MRHTTNTNPRRNPTCRYARTLRNMPPLHHSPDERKANGGDFNPNESAVAKYLLRNTNISFGECFSVIPEAWKSGVIIYDRESNRYFGRNYTGPLPSKTGSGEAHDPKPRPGTTGDTDKQQPTSKSRKKRKSKKSRQRASRKHQRRSPK